MLLRWPHSCHSGVLQHFCTGSSSSSTACASLTDSTRTHGQPNPALSSLNSRRCHLVVEAFSRRTPCVHKKQASNQAARQSAGGSWQMHTAGAAQHAVAVGCGSRERSGAVCCAVLPQALCCLCNIPLAAAQLSQPQPQSWDRGCPYPAFAASCCCGSAVAQPACTLERPGWYQNFSRGSLEGWKGEGWSQHMGQCRACATAGVGMQTEQLQ